VAIITMSSNVGFNLSMQRRGLPIAYMMSLGNRLKFDIHDAIRLIAQQDEVTALGLYLETLPDPKAFEEAVNFARELGKPIVAIKTGRSDVGRKMVVSHTASLAGSDALISALFRRLGVARVESLEALIESLKVLHVLGPLRGGRIGAMSTSGGDLTLLADALPSSLSMPPLSPEVTDKLRSVVHEQVKPTNPLDWQMFTWNDEEKNADMFTAFLSEGFDVSLCLLDYPRADKCGQSTWLGAERGFVRAVKATNSKGAVMATFADTADEAVAERLMQDGVALLAGINEGVAGIRAAVEIGLAWSKPLAQPLLGNIKEEDADPQVLNEADAKDVLRNLGINVPEGKKAEGVEQVVAEAEAMGYPVVVKALGVAHKTDVGGVKLNLRNAEEVAEAVLAMSHITNTFLIERMFRDALAELLVGVTRDEQFGLYLVVGTGGVWVEMMADTASLLLPTTREEVEKAIRGLKISLVLDGFRGAKPADVKSGVDVIMKVAQLVERNVSTLMEMEINPMLMLPEGQGAVAVDALVRVRGELHE
jgi:acyl-CoA synthetase (NDP forming)